MALIVVTSAGCAPGATTCGLALALFWPRATVFVDADPNPTQAVLAGYLGGSHTDPGGLTAVAARHRSRVDLDIPSTAMTLPSLGGPDVPRWFVPGWAHPGAAAVFAPVWNALAPDLVALHRRQIDVVVDIGRMGAGFPPALLTHAQLVLVVTRTGLRDLAALRVHLPTLREHHERLDSTANLALAVVGSGQPYRAGEIAAAFDLPVWASIADDPDAAAVYSDGEDPGRRHLKSEFVTSIQGAVDELRGRLRPVGAR